MADEQKICFVVMGFGKKTDYELGVTFDLNATYEAIIKPAAEESGFRCIRGDEIMHAGVIDTKMYEMLYRADLVIADISTGNVNAVYELGVRHALCPNATIIMKEDKGKLSFDLSHNMTFYYGHLGEDIGAREAKRAKNDLVKLISGVTTESAPDSPVYTYLPNLKRPQMSDTEFEDYVDDAEAANDRLSNLITSALKFQAENRFKEAADLFRQASGIKPEDDYITQQFALSTYKSKYPTPIEALDVARDIIDRLNPIKSNDPETLGICGAIYKNKFLVTGDASNLDSAIMFYGRGYEITRNYYVGENLALCFEYRSAYQTDPNEILFDRMSARKVRVTIIEILNEIEKEDNFKERSDLLWFYATKANCLFASGQIDAAEEAEAKFRAMSPLEWQRETYEKSKDAVIKLHGTSIGSPPTDIELRTA